jgi:two-component system, NtrC family, response regulator HydG
VQANRAEPWRQRRGPLAFVLDCAHMQTPHILVVDDETGIRESLTLIFEREGHRVSSTDSGEQALELLRKDKVDIVLADIMMPKMSGIELLRAVKALSPAVEVVMMTAFGTVENAVECMREGAYDFITKPLKRAIVVRSVQRALERRTLLHENRVLREAISALPRGEIIGQSEAMRRTLELVAQAAPSVATILLSGESGTGKELLARYVHRLSERANGPFVAVNCAALPESLLESELFGHERGAFTGATERREGRFERASEGTLFLDEVGEMAPAVQVRLLRVLQEGELERVGGQTVVQVSVRVVAATNRTLEDDVEAGRFREDLYYRLNVIRVQVPPLRVRHGDVVLLAQHFLGVFANKNKKSMRGFSDAALQALDAHQWPGSPTPTMTYALTLVVFSFPLGRLSKRSSDASFTKRCRAAAATRKQQRACWASLRVRFIVSSMRTARPVSG